MSSEFALPDVGEGLTEAEIVEWKVAAGDTVAITVEPEGGSEQPTTEPIVAVTST